MISRQAQSNTTAAPCRETIEATLKTEYEKQNEANKLHLSPPREGLINPCVRLGLMVSDQTVKPGTDSKHGYCRDEIEATLKIEYEKLNEANKLHLSPPSWV